MKQYENCIENVPCLEFEKETIKNKIQLRKVFSVQPIHLAANVLDPKYFGKQLTPEENIDAATFIHKLSKVCVGIDECKVMNDFAQFKVIIIYYYLITYYLLVSKIFIYFCLRLKKEFFQIAIYEMLVWNQSNQWCGGMPFALLLNFQS